MSSTTQDVTVLNTLIATLLDSIDGYEKAAADVGNRQFAERFEARARERQTAVTSLQSAVAALGGNPEDDGSLLASAHRAFLNLKEAVTGTDDKAIVAEVERGEDYLKEKFQTALRNSDMSPQALAAAQTAWDSVKSGHDEMSALKHSIGA